MPTIAFGTWKLGNGDGPIAQVDQAISVGFSHVGQFIFGLLHWSDLHLSVLDTAQAYRNEKEAGAAIRDSGLKRSEIFITTKYSGLDGLDIKTSIKNSLDNVRLRFCSCFEMPTCILVGSHICRPLPHSSSRLSCSGHTHRLERDGEDSSARFGQVGDVSELMFSNFTYMPSGASVSATSMSMTWPHCWLQQKYHQLSTRYIVPPQLLFVYLSVECLHTYRYFFIHMSTKPKPR